MVKSKKASLKVARKIFHRGHSERKNNPFEIHTNKRKHDILGRKIKHERGLPGVSRSRAIKKRQKTLLVEYKQKNKANMFIDHRFGEYDETMSLEEKMMKRFAMEKKHHHERRGLFALEDEDLTHLGQSLGDINKFEDVQLSDDDDENNDDDVEDVKELHFGGFLKKKKLEEQQSNENQEKHKSKKEIMEEVVAKAKIKKYERQIAKEQTLSLTEQVDKDWKSIKSLISHKGPHSNEKTVKADDYDIAVRQLAFEIKRKKPHINEKTVKADDYDIAVRQLAFEIKGKATDRLKSEQELAKEEQARLEKLELQRQRRMKGLPEKEEKAKHRSADDLGDSFTPAVDERVLLSYQEGAITALAEEADDEDHSDAKDSGKEGGETDEEETAEGQEKDDDDDDVSDDDGDVAATDDDDDDDGDNDDDVNDGQVEREGEVDAEESEENGDGSDLESDVSGDELAEIGNSRQTHLTQKEITKQNVQKRANSIVTNDLPYTFKAPKSFAEFEELIQGWPYKDQLTIVERIKACHNPKITPDNKPKMQVFFAILLDYVGRLALKGSEGVKMIDMLSRSMFDVAQHSPVSAAKHMQEKVKTIHKKFTEERDRQGGKGKFLGLPELLYLRLVPMLFSASDFKHAVCTPGLLLMSQVLSESPVRCIRDVFRGLFICQLFLEYVSLSKRFVPEAVNFLCGILFLASNKKGSTPQLVPPFKPGCKLRDLLRPLSDGSSFTVRPLPLTKTLEEGTEEELTSDEMRINTLTICLRLLHKFVALYKDLPSNFEIFFPVKMHLLRIPLNVFPPSFKDLHGELLKRIKDLHDTSLSRRHLTSQARRPEAIRTFEPKFEESFIDRHRVKLNENAKNERGQDPAILTEQACYEIRSRRAGSKKTNERQKLRYKYKKEFKGAVREIRKDNQFLAKQKLRDQLERDAERMRKVKEIEHMLSNQQAEANALNRKKRKLGK